MEFRYDVFLSHSSADKPVVEFLARKLEAVRITPFLDKWNLIPGEPWQEALEEALDESRTCAVFVGPKGIGPWQNEEMRSALEDRVRDKAFRVIPVLLPGSLESNKEKLPRFLRRLTWVDFRDGLEDENAFHRLISGIRGTAPGSGGSGGGKSIKPRSILYRCMIQRPEGFVPRQEYKKVIEALLSGNQDSHPVGITTALQGAGGFGKTFLAQQICFDDRVRERFPDGILWTTMGEDITPEGRLSRIRDLIRWWTDKEAPAFETVTTAGAKLRELLATSRVLVVVDDVWNPADLPPFQGFENGSALLITTRDQQTLPRNSEKILVDAMVSREAVQLLRSGLPDGLDREFERLSADLGEWPLLLGLVNRQLLELVRGGLDSSGALKEARDALKSQGFSAFDRDDPDSRHAAASKAVLISIQRLSEKERDLYLRLAVFPEDVNIPLSLLQRLWSVEGFQARNLCRRLFRLSLLRNLDYEQETIRLHDVVRRILIEQFGKSLAETHRQILESFRPANEKWESVDPGEVFFWTYIGHHFLGAGWRDDFRELLLHFPFIDAKFSATDINALIGDYEVFSGERELWVVQSALRLSAHVLFKYRRQLAGQLLGRLLGFQDKGIERLLTGAQAVQMPAWIRPRRPCLSSPGPLIRILDGHTGGINSVAVVNGRRVISASSDRTLQVWDLDSGQTLQTLGGHTGEVNSVAVVVSCRAVSASSDGTLRVWDLDSGQTIKILEGHTGRINSVAVIDGRRVVSASSDRTLRVWDLYTGLTLRILAGHTGEVWSVAVVDGCHAISGSLDGTIRVWNLDDGETVRILLGHDGWVTSIAMADGHRVVSTSWDRSLRVWDLDTGQTLRTIQSYGRRGSVLQGAAISVAVVDSHRAVSGSDDGTLWVWDLDTGKPLRTLEGHTARVRSLTVKDRHLLSGSDDGTVRLWDLEISQSLRTIQGHLDQVRSVAVNTHIAVSGSDDQTLEVWALDTGQILGRNFGHTDWVTSVTMDSSRIVSASCDWTIKVWDLASGTLLQEFEDHTGVVISMAVVDDRRAISGLTTGVLRVWDLNNGQTLRTLHGHTGWVRSVAVVDGYRAVSGSDDGTVRVWDLDSGKSIHVLKGHTEKVSAVAVVDDYRAISASEDQTLRVWDLDSGQPLRTLEGHFGRVYSVAVVDGRLAVSASFDRTLRVWDLKTGEEISVMTLDAPVLAVAYSAERRIVVVGDQAGNVHFFDLVEPE